MSIDREEVVTHLERVAETESGIYLYRWLMEICGFQKASCVLGPAGEINPLSTVFNDAKRGVYIEIRNCLSPQSIAKIEGLQLKEVKSCQELKEQQLQELKQQGRLPTHRVEARNLIRMEQDQEWRELANRVEGTTTEQGQIVVPVNLFPAL